MVNGRRAEDHRAHVVVHWLPIVLTIVGMTAALLLALGVAVWNVSSWTARIELKEEHEQNSLRENGKRLDDLKNLHMRDFDHLNHRMLEIESLLRLMHPNAGGPYPPLSNAP